MILGDGPQGRNDAGGFRDLSGRKVLWVVANLSGGAPSIATFLSVDSLKFMVRGIIFVGIPAYWLRTRVRQYFHVERTSRIKALTLSAVGGIGITVLITVVLQSIILFRTR